ncbi:MAG TPA: hypothetical protein VHD62_02400, partial [Opitutaceae bacterium]|nr:hypothetical protein [Opitutaceae bacterium]
MISRTEGGDRGSPVFVGIDIGKSALDVSAGGRHFRVGNDRAGFQGLIAEVRACHARVQFVCEASSGMCPAGDPIDQIHMVTCRVMDRNPQGPAGDVEGPMRIATLVASERES